jgi:coatomer subunit beta
MFINLEDENRRANAFAAEAMFIIASIIHFGKSGLPKMAITEDDLDRFVF